MGTIIIEVPERKVEVVEVITAGPRGMKGDDGTFTGTLDENVEITDATKGLILRSPNGTRYLFTAEDDGRMKRVALAIITALAMLIPSGVNAQGYDVVTDGDGKVIAPTNFWQANASNIPIPPPTNTGVVAGTYGNSNAVSQFTVDEKGRLTGATNVALWGTNMSPLLIDTNGRVQWTNVLTVPRIYMEVGGDELTLNPWSLDSISYNFQIDFETRTIFLGGHNLTLLNGGFDFAGTNAALYKAQTRTNLGLGWPALTNTNASGFRDVLGLGPFATATNLTSTNIRNWTNALSSASVWYANVADWSVTSTSLQDSATDEYALGVEDGVWTGDLAGLNAALGTPTSGAAPTNAVLQADGNGGSAFVAAGGRVGYTTSSNLTKADWSSVYIHQFTNVATSPFPTLTLKGGKTYRIEYLVRFNGYGATNGFPVHGIVIATNVVGGHTMWVGTGINSTGNASGINVSTNSDQTWLNFPPTVSSNLRAMSGSVMIYIPTNTTAVYSWCPSENVTNTWTLEAPSSVFVTEMP